MKDYTAKNGAVVKPHNHGSGVTLDGIEIMRSELDALREYFGAEEDERLGRWRHPDHPHIYARPMNYNPNIIGIVRDTEDGLAYGQFTRGQESRLDPMTIVAAAYFEAHPEPKPWHDAKPGEVWSIEGVSADRDAPKAPNGGSIALCYEDATGPMPQMWFVYGDGGASDYLEIEDRKITAGTRLYSPEEGS